MKSSKSVESERPTLESLDILRNLIQTVDAVGNELNKRAGLNEASMGQYAAIYAAFKLSVRLNFPESEFTSQGLILVAMFSSWLSVVAHQLEAQLGTSESKFVN